VSKLRLPLLRSKYNPFPAPAFAAAIPPSSSQYFESKKTHPTIGPTHPARNSETTGFYVHTATGFTSSPGAAIINGKYSGEHKIPCLIRTAEVQIHQAGMVEVVR
jgi:hypothetical protein